MKNKKVMKVGILSHLPKEETFVKISNNIRNEIFGKAQDTTLTGLANKLNIDLKNLSRYRLGQRSIPLNILYDLLELFQIDIDKLQNNLSIKVGKNGTHLRIDPYITIDEDWVYISQFLNSDGHLSKSLWYVCFINKEIELIKFIRNFFENLGMKSHSIDLRKSRGCYFLTIRSKLLLYLFNSIFKVPIGRKEIITIPDFIKENKSLGCSALRAIFDSEGTVTSGTKKWKSPRRIVICQKDKTFLEESQYILNKLGIQSRISLDQKRIYRLYITHQNNLRKFLELVNPLHPIKKEKLKNTLDTFDKNRVPQGDLRVKILSLFKKKGDLKRSEMSVLLNIKMTKFSSHLKWLQEKSLIMVAKKIVTKNGSYYIYRITNQGKNYLANEYWSL